MLVTSECVVQKRRIKVEILAAARSWRLGGQGSVEDRMGGRSIRGESAFSKSPLLRSAGKAFNFCFWDRHKWRFPTSDMLTSH